MTTHLNQVALHFNFRFLLALATFLLLGCLDFAAMAQSEAAPAEEDQAVLEVIKAAVPAATAMDEIDWRTLAESSTVKLPPPTLMGLYVRIAITGEETDEEKAEYGYIDSIPEPVKLARVISSGDHRTWVKSKHITDMTCKVDGNKAEGEFTFLVPKMVRGKVRYTATKEEGEWKLTGFALPVRKLRIKLNKEGKWTNEEWKEKK